MSKPIERKPTPPDDILGGYYGKINEIKPSPVLIYDQQSSKQIASQSHSVAFSNIKTTRNQFKSGEDDFPIDKSFIVPKMEGND